MTRQANRIASIAAALALQQRHRTLTPLDGVRGSPPSQAGQAFRRGREALGRADQLLADGCSFLCCLHKY
jgi:hypothetical protein